jgi:hypothetical protein
MKMQIKQKSIYLINLLSRIEENDKINIATANETRN